MRSRSCLQYSVQTRTISLSSSFSSTCHWSSKLVMLLRRYVCHDRCPLAQVFGTGSSRIESIPLLVLTTGLEGLSGNRRQSARAVRYWSMIRVD